MLRRKQSSIGASLDLQASLIISSHCILTLNLFTIRNFLSFNTLYLLLTFHLVFDLLISSSTIKSLGKSHQETLATRHLRLANSSIQSSLESVLEATASY